MSVIGLVVVHVLLILAVILVIASATATHVTRAETFSRRSPITHPRFWRGLVVVELLLVLLFSSMVCVFVEIIVVFVVLRRLAVFLSDVVVVAVLVLRNISIFVREERSNWKTHQIDK